MKQMQPASAGRKALTGRCSSASCRRVSKRTCSPSPAHAAKWPGIVYRMVPRMQGRGNMGRLMADMMAGVQAPDAEETRVLVAYLRRHAQKTLDPRRYPDVNSPAGESFRVACGQCHALPDPRRHTAEEWR